MKKPIIACLMAGLLISLQSFSQNTNISEDSVTQKESFFKEGGQIGIKISPVVSTLLSSGASQNRFSIFFTKPMKKLHLNFEPFATILPMNESESFVQFDNQYLKRKYSSSLNEFGTVVSIEKRNSLSKFLKIKYGGGITFSHLSYYNGFFEESYTINDTLNNGNFVMTFDQEMYSELRSNYVMGGVTGYLGFSVPITEKMMIEARGTVFLKYGLGNTKEYDIDGNEVLRLSKGSLIDSGMFPLDIYFTYNF